MQVAFFFFYFLFLILQLRHIIELSRFRFRTGGRSDSNSAGCTSCVLLSGSLSCVFNSIACVRSTVLECFSLSTECLLLTMYRFSRMCLSLQIFEADRIEASMLEQTTSISSVFLSLLSSSSSAGCGKTPLYSPR